MKKIVLFLIIFAITICPNAQAAKKPKVITLKPVRIAKLNKKDLTIKEVVAGSPFEKAGFKVGDEIKKVNKKRFSSIEKLMDCVTTLEEEKEAIFEIKRDGKKKIIAVMPRSESPRFGFTVVPKRCYEISKENKKDTFTMITGEECGLGIADPRVWPTGLLFVNLLVRNLSDEEVTFDPSQIRVLAIGTPLKMLSPEETTNIEFVKLSAVEKLPPLQPTQMSSSVSQSVNVGPSGSYTISGPAGQVRVQEDFGSAFLRSMQVASQARIEKFRAEIAAYPMRKREALEAAMINREEEYLALLRKYVRKTVIKPGESMIGLVAFDNAYYLTDIEIKVKVGDEEFKAKFEEYKRYTPK